MVVADDAANRIQPQTGPLAHSLGGKKGFIDVRQNVGRDSRSVVANFHEDAVQFARRPHSQLALALHGLDGVGNQIRPNLIELTALGADFWEILVVLAHYVHSTLEAVVENRQGILQPLMQVDDLHGRLVHV